MALIVGVILFVERPADALHRAALYLTFHVGGMDGLAGVLNRSVANDFHLAGVLVNFHVNDVNADAGAGSAGVDAAAPHDGASGRHLAGGQLLKGHLQLVVGPMLEHAVSNFTSSGSTSQMRAALAIICCLMSWAAV